MEQYGGMTRNLYICDDKHFCKENVHHVQKGINVPMACINGRVKHD